MKNQAITTHPHTATLLAVSPAQMTKPLDVKELQKQFIEEQDVSTGTRATYKRVIHRFFTWLADKGVYSHQLERADIIAYKEGLRAEGINVRTIALYLGVVRRFYEWTETKVIYPNVAKGVKAPRNISKKFQKEPLSAEKSTELLTHFKESGLRDFAMVNLMLRTGLRTIEVRRLDVGDITYKGDQRVLLVHGKGHSEKDAFVLLTEKAYEPIAHYLASKETAPTDPLFTSASYKKHMDENNEPDPRMTTRSIRRIVKEGLQAIGLDAKQFSAHSLRHTTAVTILRNGGTLQHAQDVLRHTDPATTQIYTAFAKEELRLKDAGEHFIDAAF